MDYDELCVCGHFQHQHEDGGQCGFCKCQHYDNTGKFVKDGLEDMPVYVLRDSDGKTQAVTYTRVQAEHTARRYGLTIETATISGVFVDSLLENIMKSAKVLLNILR